MAAQSFNPAISAKRWTICSFAGGKLNVKLLGGAQEMVGG
jgi:hypothetical protein